MSTVPKTDLSHAEYLRRERAADYKSEYYKGEMFAMAGASRKHNLIAGNLVREFGNELKLRSCEVYPSDMRVKVDPTGLYTYPDVVVVCDEPKLEDEHFDTLLNPTLLVEVLSDSTESYDRGPKFKQFRRIGSLKEFVLVAQDRISVECYVRRSDDTWTLRDYDAIEEIVRFESLGVEVAMEEIYRRVTVSI